MSKELVKKICKRIYSFRNIKISGPLFHTSRNSVLPSMAQRENCTLDYLQCLRPAEMSVSDAHTLAGDPRVPGRWNEQGIESEVFEKWDQTLKSETVRNDWSSYKSWEHPIH